MKVLAAGRFALRVLWQLLSQVLTNVRGSRAKHRSGASLGSVTLTMLAQGCGSPTCEEVWKC